jgi:hypothetical protein
MEKDIADEYYDIIVEKASEKENQEKGSFVYCIPEDVLIKIIPSLKEKGIIKGIDEGSTLGFDYRHKKINACVLYLVEKGKLKKERKDEIVRTLEELIQHVKESEEIWNKPRVI